MATLQGFRSLAIYGVPPRWLQRRDKPRMDQEPVRVFLPIALKSEGVNSILTPVEAVAVRTAIRNTHAVLAGSPASSPRLDAELLVGHVLGWNRTRLLANPEHLLTAAASAELARLLDHRLTGTPMAYLLGRRDFMTLTLEVGPGVLVPRPETELLVEWAIEFLKAKDASHPHLVIDVGTGAGAIALSIAEAFSESALHVVGCDISPAALQWADRNRQALGLATQVDLVLGDLVSWLGTPATMLIANLPYLRPDQVRGNWQICKEPEIALVSGADGLGAIGRLLVGCGRVLAPGGAIALEIDPSQSAQVFDMMKRFLPGLQTRVMHDLAGHDRFVIGIAE